MGTPVGRRNLDSTPDHRAAFRDQATPELQLAALRYARQRANLVRRAGGRIDHLYPRELVQDALADTWLGTVAWDPATCSLLDHVRGVIKSRSWKHACGARERPHVSIDSKDRAVASQADLARRHATAGSLSPILLARLTATVVGDLERLAAGDPAAAAILRAWADGAIERGEVLAHTGLAEKDYRAARARLAYLVMSLPQSLRDTARTLLRSAA